MKRLAICLCFIISMVVSSGVNAQNNAAKAVKSSESPVPPVRLESATINKWKNSVEPFVGVWSLEGVVLDDESKEQDICLGTFMIINADASYTIFVYMDGGAFITSQGVILVDSSYEYIEVISHHMNKSLVGVSNRIDYKLDADYLNKSFWIEKDKLGHDYKRQVNETWKRAKMPAPGEYDNNPAFPI